MLYHTENGTTIQYGREAIATVICDSISHGVRITTLELVYPRYIHSELMTHRMFSRNASSSRATPINVLLNEVRNDCTFFEEVGVNQPGMCAGELLNDEDYMDFKQEWFDLAKDVADRVEYLKDKYNVHKQVLNRALEPFSRIRTLVTATQWDNFFKLRLAPDAQPEMRSLANAMRLSMTISKPVERDSHMPYITPADDELNYNDKVKCSIARCARVSYGRANGKASNIDSDLILYEKLETSGHFSPFEHVASFLWHDSPNAMHNNFRGWTSARYLLGFDCKS